MDSDIQDRLKEASQNCIDAFLEWEDKKKDPKAQEGLHAAIHELRKVSSRLEIELAMSERDQLAAKPLPIPPHRSNMKSGPGSILDGELSGGGDNAPSNNRYQKRRRPPVRKKKSGNNEGQ